VSEAPATTSVPSATPGGIATCRQSIARNSKSFALASRLLPGHTADHAAIVYAWCRRADDAVDAVPAAAAPAAVRRLRQELADVYRGAATGVPELDAFAAVVEAHAIPREYPDELLAGMQMDCERARYASFDELLLYCHRVAGVVGLMSARIFGFSDPKTLDYAAELGLAFQLTNIVRDVGEDARRNRVYLPLDELKAAGLEASQIVHGSAETEAGEPFRKLMQAQIDRALATYDRAFALLPAVDRKAQIPGIIMAAIYRTLLEEIRADGAKVLTQRTSLTPLRKLWIAWKTWIRR